MKTIRIIPRLDIKGPNLVKGIHLEGLRVLGKPEDFARFYYENGADELIFQDVVASLYERNSLEDVISQTAKQMFIPLTVGGGIRTLDDINRVLRAGADKVAINTAAIKNPLFIKEASKKFGSSTIVIAIEAIRQPNGEYLAFTDNGREHTGIEVGKWAEQAQALGAGEILLTSVDREGTGLGFDTALVELIANKISVPLIIHGGAGSVKQIEEGLLIESVDAVALGSVLHYHFIKNHSVDLSTRSEGNIDFLLSGRHFDKLSPIDLRTLKEHFVAKEYNCRKII